MRTAENKITSVKRGYIVLEPEKLTTNKTPAVTREGIIFCSYKNNFLSIRKALFINLKK